MTLLQDSWNSFSPKVAKEYLKTYGSPSVSSKHLLLDVLRRVSARISNPKIIDLGCGNCQLAEFFKAQNFSCRYTGVDFSEVLLGAAKSAMPEISLIKSDVNFLSEVSGSYDIAIYSHVLELLSAPEDSLFAAKNLSKIIVIRFYEPPEFDRDSVELRWLDNGSDSRVPYIRRQLSKDYYSLILSRIGCTKVEIYRDIDKDQIHVLSFN
jgi:ubiquinone/menaquinone biosynthesis C-methylase UbiE